VFFPAAGYRDGSDGGADFRGRDGLYWSSGPNNYSYRAGSLYFHSSNVDMYNNLRAYGYSVRCVQE
jgi:hypothetical protein